MGHFDAYRHAARGLARALLAGPMDCDSACARCAEALGRRPHWLRPLVEHALAEFAERWHGNALPALAEAIHRYADGRNWWHGPAPTIRKMFFNPPAIARDWLVDHGVVLPDLPTPGDLARWLGLEIAELEWLAARPWRAPGPGKAPSHHYAVKWVDKRSGGLRPIEAPKQQLREVQRRILRDVIDFIPPHPAAHGFRRGHSCVTHARQHVGQAVVLRLDIEDFFLAIGAARVRAVFETVGFPAPVAALLARLTATHVPPHLAPAAQVGACAVGGLSWLQRKRALAPHLPQGAPSSPGLANLCAFNLDRRLLAAATAAGARYSRYADDLTFSGDDAFARGVQRFIVLAAAIALEEGFALNLRKTRVASGGHQQKVTGIVVNQHPNIPRTEFDRLKAILHNCARDGPGAHNRDAHPDFRAHLAGRIAHVRAINPLRAARLERVFACIAWPASERGDT